jgi:hypothetical protein
MSSKLIILALSALVAAASSGCADAPTSTGEPLLDVSPYRHGNLASAQELLRGAYDRLGEAQQANNSELGGHAARAKELLREADGEIKLAAITANNR